MKNHLFKKCSLLLLSAFTLSSCGLQFFDIIEDLSISDFSSLDSSVSSSSSSSEVTSYTSGEVISANTIENPIYVEDAIAKIDELGLVSTGDLSEYAYYLKGDVSSSTYVEKYDCFNLWLRTDEVEQAFQVYRAHLQPGLDTVDYRAPNALKDATVVVWGFLQL